LAARRADELGVLAKDLLIRGASEAFEFPMDLATADPQSGFQAMVDAIGPVDVVLLAYGVLTDQAQAEIDPGYASQQIQTNFVSAAGWSLSAARILKSQGSGVLIVIGSVAGDRRGQAAFVYGAAKAGLSVLIQGVAESLRGSGARAVLVKPGLIDTPMTADFSKRGPFWSQADTIAKVICRVARSSGSVVYAPGYWRFILIIVRLDPRRLFRRA
jgi:short-subunit dehydrogenase